nr:transposase (putative), gypsy type [Tanacetum cinerariifolium]
MGRDTVQLETAVTTISQEYLLEFTSEYGIPEALYPELPRPEDRIVDFPEGAAKVSHFEINCRVLNIIPTLSLFRVFYTPSFNSGWMSFSKRPGKNTPQCYTKPLDSLKNWNNRFFWVDERVFSTVMDWRTNAPKDGMPAENTYSAEAVRILDTHRTPIQKQPEALLCLVGLSRRYYLRDEVYPTFFHDDVRDMDLFSLIRAPNPTKVKTESRLCAAHEVPLLTLTANRVIGMEDPATATDSSSVPSIIERSPLDFANEAGAKDQRNMAPEVPPPEDVPTTRGAPDAGQAEKVAATDPSAIKESRKRGHDGVDANAPPKSAPANVSDPDPLSFADPRSRHPSDVAQSSQGTAAAGDLESENTSFASVVRSPESIYQSEWGIANGSILDTPEACLDLVDHVTPSGYFSELRHLRNDDFLRQYNVNLARQAQLRLRFEQEAKLLKKFVAQVARRDKRIQAREHEIKNLKALLEAEADMKKATEDQSAKLSQELENMRALFLDLQVSNDHLSQQVATLQEQVSGEEKLKAAFEKFKYHRRSQVDDRTWVALGRGKMQRILRAEAGVCRCRAIEAYDPEAEAKYIAALQALKNLKYPLVDQLEGLKDAPMDVIMAALHLESDTGDDVPQWVRELHPRSSQLTVHVYLEVRDPMNPWAYKEEMLLADAIAANVSCAEKKKKCRIVCRTHGVGSALHARSDGVPVSAPTVVPQGLAILLADAATQTESDDATLNNL